MKYAEYLLAATVVVVIGATFFLIMHARSETRMVARPAFSARRVARRAPVVAGDPCACGGVLGPSGQVSDKFGTLLGCTGCNRTWSVRGRWLVSRSGRRTRADPDQPAALAEDEQSELS